MGQTEDGDDIIDEVVTERYEDNPYTLAIQRLNELTWEYLQMPSVLQEIGAYFMVMSNPMS